MAKPIEQRIHAKIKRENGCWLWQGCLSGEMKHPHIYYVGRMVNARKLMWQMVGNPLPEKEKVLYLRCGQEVCINPEHMDVRTRNRYHGRGRTSKLSEEQVKRIKDRLWKGEQGKVLAAEFGVSKQCISAINVGRHWRSV